MIVGKVNMRYVAFVAVVAAVGGFLFGYDTAVISGTIDTVAGQFSLDALQKGWYVGCALVGSIFGVSVAGMLGDSIGRKRSMILSAVLFTVSAFGCAVSATFAELVAYRIVGGVGIGIVSVISPLYISEMSVPKHRGRLVSLYQLASVGAEKRTEWRELSQKSVRKMVIVGVAIAILGQFMGVNAVLYYGPSIFSDSGLSSGDSLFYQVLVGSVNMLTTILALLIIDKVGRKKLVYYGVGGMIVSLLLIAAYFACGQTLGISPVALLVVFLAYIFCCAISICVVVWVLLSEMYPTKVRGLAMSIAGLSLWVGTYLIGQLTPWMLSTLAPAGTFLLFAVMCVPYILIVWRLVPETKGLSLEEIEKITK